METNTSHDGAGPLCARFSTYARQQLSANPGLADKLAAMAATSIGADTVAALVKDPAATRIEPARRLRAARRLTMLAAMERDLAGSADLAEVTLAMSVLADESIALALSAAVAGVGERLGTPIGSESGLPQTLHVVGMGKLGGRELNVSSDIDLIFLYPEEGQTQGGKMTVSNQEYFGQVGKHLIATLSEHTPDGYVFRVDMRLRPWGDGPLAMGFGAFEDYLVAHGRDWERYAWIKGRVISGDREAELMTLVTPFVYRRYLDFGAIEALKGLHVQIEREVARRELDDHVKLGPGGIREVEFVAQAMQLIRGGRDARLRVRPTVPVLRMLGEMGLMATDAVEELARAYDYLRRVEHRLQYAEDQQTHLLPRGDEARQRLASSMGCADWTAFKARLDAHRGNVRRHFEGVLGNDPAAAADTRGEDSDFGSRLAQAGYSDPADLARLIDATLAGAKVRRLAESSRARFALLLPRMIDAAGATTECDAALRRLLAFAESIASRASYLALLAQSAPALNRLARLCGASEWAARYLTLHPILLDELLDEGTLYAPIEAHGFSSQAGAALQGLRGDLEAQMNALREQHHTAVFRLLAQDLEGLWSVEALADQLSELADRALSLALIECWALVKDKHREIPEFAVIAYGKLGGKELGYASDLDLIFIHDDPHERAGEVYARLAQRLVTFLDTQTTAGRLFEIDTRLRPDGVSGMLVTSLSAFRDYQRRRAWLWEHQALTRARFCAGTERIGAAFEAERRHILTLDRDVVLLRAEVLAMRKKMHDGHPNRSPLFDLKHDAGGMVDIEFCVQTLVLAHARTHPQLVGNFGNIALLRMSGEAGLIPADIAATAANAYRAYRRRQHALRLNNAQYARVPAQEFAAEIEGVKALWKRVLES